jgi:D-3-phosphoglycerate dehydrogenase / 2-oxoglutarate reductase
MNKILITTSSFDLNNFKENERLIKEKFDLQLNPFERKMTEEQITGLIDDNVIAMIAGTEPLTESVLLKAKGLKIIVRCGIGMDNVDMNAANKLGIQVFNTPDAPTRSVAELTLGHILSLLRRIPESDRMIRGGEWKALMGSLLYEQTVGVIGYGRIGKMVSKLLLAFGAKVLVYDIFTNDKTDDITFVSKQELLKHSDIITLHIPYTADNHHFINEEAFSLIKTNAMIVNVSRGGLIDDIALYKAISEKKIAGAALDCFEQEPYNGPLIDCNNVLLTAHMGSYAKQSRIQQEIDSCYTLVREMKLINLI